MLSRENIEISATERTFDFYIPIYKEIISKCSIPDEINLAAATNSFKTCISYKYLRQAIEYEISYREKICETIISDYYKKSDGMERLFLLFNELGVDARKQIGRAHTIDHYLTVFTRKFENSGFDSAKDDLLSEFAYKREVYFKPSKYSSDKKSLLRSYVNHYAERFELWTKYRIGDVINKPVRIIRIEDDALQDKLNLLWFTSDRSDGRNTLIITDFPRIEFSLNDVNLDEYYPNLAYNNCNRVFEDLFSAVFGRELVLNYLNELLASC